MDKNWIRVEDGLPDEGTKVLVYEREHGANVARMYRTRVARMVRDDDPPPTWDRTEWWESTDRVTHWMPLPASPNTEDDRLDVMNDLISRQAAIAAIHAEFDECLVWDESGKTTANEVERILDCLPSAEPPKGE